MPLINVVVALIVVGVLLWLVNTYIPMDGKIKKILNAVVVICVVVWLLYAFGVINHSGEIRVPQVRLLQTEKAPPEVKDIYEQFHRRMSFPSAPYFIMTQGHSPGVARGTWE